MEAILPETTAMACLYQSIDHVVALYLAGWDTNQPGDMHHFKVMYGKH